MYYAASLFAAFLVTLIVVSKVAEMLLAKRFSMGWVLLASLVGGASAVIVSLLLSIFVAGVDPMVMLIISISVMFVVSSAAFKYINIMSWSGAITTNIANIAVALIGVTAAVVLNGESLDKTIASINSKAKSNVSMVKTAASGSAYVSEEQDLAGVEESQQLAMSESDELLSDSSEDEILEEGFEPTVTELQMILPGAAREIKRKEQKKYTEPKYRIINVGSIHALVGKPIRILKSNGSVISGSLKKINGSDAYVAQRLRSGVATTPIAIAKIRKLEVYR